MWTETRIERNVQMTRQKREAQVHGRRRDKYGHELRDRTGVRRRLGQRTKEEDQDRNKRRIRQEQED